MGFTQFARSFLFICILGSIGGCAGNFVRPDTDSVKLGKSKPGEVTSLVSGQPTRRNVEVNNEKIDTIIYNYVGNVPFYGSVIPHRSLTYSFFHDVLVGEEFISTYDDERTEFDTNKVPQVRNGQTKDQVISIMGAPSGKVLYPLIGDKNGSGLVYAYSYSRFAPLVSPSWSYLLIVTFDEKGVVTNISYKENGKEVIAQRQ